MRGRSGDQSSAPRVRCVRFVLVGLLGVASLGTLWTAFQLVQGTAPRDAVESGVAVGASASLVSVGAELFRRRQRYAANPYGLTREDREQAADAAAGRGPLPQDPRVLEEALRFARDMQQGDPSGGRLGLVLLLVGLVGFGVAGALGSRWWFLAGAALLPLLTVVPSHLRQRARLTELQRAVAMTR